MRSHILRSGLAVVALVLTIGAVASMDFITTARAAGSILSKPWPDKSQPVDLFHNMDVQQFTKLILTKKADGLYHIWMQCENGQQWRAFHYTMNVVFKGTNGRPLYVYRINCDLNGRAGGSNNKTWREADVNLGGILDKIIEVALWGERYGDTHWPTVLIPKPQSLQEVLFPVCWGNPSECREANGKVDNIVIPSRQMSYSSSLRVDCADIRSGSTTGDETVTAFSNLSSGDARAKLTLVVADYDSASLDLCQLNNNMTRRERRETRRFVE